MRTAAVSLSFFGRVGLAVGWNTSARTGARKTAGKVMMPWQKPQPKRSAPSNFLDILPWLLSENGSKAQSQSDTASAWETKIDQPDEPREADDRRMGGAGSEDRNRRHSFDRPGAEEAAASRACKDDGRPRFKARKWTALLASCSCSKSRPALAAGDQPHQGHGVAEVDANASDVAEPAAAEEAPAVNPQLASPVAANERRQRLRLPSSRCTPQFQEVTV